ncbi:MAG TPA: ATP-binding protein [Jatrophihabitantaceae bacterium]|jgi:anti-sigma regulatory factor (Ser/Thr protein kinase)|nr:ATP-binding protein [Jatrophihabitantaceae bacterium]
MGALQVRHEPASAAQVRNSLRADLRQQGLAEDGIDVVLLVTTELFGNAVRHCAPAPWGTLGVEWDVDCDHVAVRVTDASPELPRRRTPRPDQPNGRGLAIVDSLVESWGADRVSGGKQVWARIAVRREHARSEQMA